MIGRIIRRAIVRSAGGIAQHWVGLLVLLVLGGTAVTLGYWQGMFRLPGQGVASSGQAYEMSVERIEQTRQAGSYNVVLREKRGTRRLTVTVGPAEAFAIQSDLANMRSERPMTYDLMKSLVLGLGGDLNRVVVNNVTDTTFYAKVIMSSNGREVEIDSRPSDAIALALRAKVPIFADAAVLDKASTGPANN
ncbi:MAG TPA: bifunctional nuclease family protein [Chloroflexota bacterium]|nr:bifunctional nuclease family protein [Chloroflexota bacterium]